MMNYVQWASIAIEALIAVLFLIAAMRGKNYLYGITLTFAMYVVYDLIRFLDIAASEQVLIAVFFLGTLTALYSTLHICHR